MNKTLGCAAIQDGDVGRFKQCSPQSIDGGKTCFDSKLSTDAFQVICEGKQYFLILTNSILHVYNGEESAVALAGYNPFQGSIPAGQQNPKIRALQLLDTLLRALSHIRSRWEHKPSTTVSYA